MLRFVGSLSGALDRLAGTSTWSMTPDEQREALVELARAEARLSELRLRVLVQADRDDVGADSGATSTPAWLAHATRTGRTAAFADLHLARKLDETFPATKAALAAGVIDVEKASIVTAAVEALTEEPPTKRKATSWRRRRPRPGRWRTSRSATTATAPARAASSCPPCTPTS